MIAVEKLVCHSIVGHVKNDKSLQKSYILFVIIYKFLAVAKWSVLQSHERINLKEKKKNYRKINIFVWNCMNFYFYSYKINWIETARYFKKCRENLFMIEFFMNSTLSKKKKKYRFLITSHNKLWQFFSFP